MMLVLVSVAALALAQEREASSGPPAPGHVAFVLPDGRAAMVDPESRLVTQLGLEPQHAQFPAWSPDGERVAFAAFTGGSARVDVADVRDAVSVTSVYSSASDAPIYLSWAPSGDLLAVLVVDREGLALHLVDVAAARSRLFARGSPFFWSWSRTGDRLLVHRDVLGPRPLVGFTELGEFEVAEPLPDPGVFQSPALSPSERFVAYATRSAGDVRRVVVAPVVTSAPRPASSATTGERSGEERPPGDLAAARPAPGAAVAGEHDAEAPGDGADLHDEVVKREVPHLGQASLAWHPRLDLLAAQRGEASGFGSIALLDAATGELDVVVSGRSLAFFWSPDGGSIAYLTLRVGGPGWGMEQQVGATVAAQELVLPRLTINVFDLASRATRELADFVPTRLFIEQYLPFFDQYARSHRVWSPASDALVFSSLDPYGVPMVTRFGLDGSVTPLVAGEMPSYNVR
jgi:TolB protein